MHEGSQNAYFSCLFQFQIFEQHISCLLPHHTVSLGSEVISKLNTVDFSSHYQSFEVETTLPRRKLISHHKDLTLNKK